MNLIVAVPDQCDAGSCASVNRNYTRVIQRAGHVPFILPYTDRPEQVRAMMERCDALLLTGGGEDVDPARYHTKLSPLTNDVSQERDLFEWLLLDEAVRQHKPILGICRGLQVINVYFGGTLYQDLPTEYANLTAPHQSPDHRYGVAHPISILPGTRLHDLLQVDRTQVNSTHHQAVRDLAPDFVISAVADDGVVEAIESLVLPVLGVQFHPERLSIGPDELFGHIFDCLSPDDFSISCHSLSVSRG